MIKLIVTLDANNVIGFRDTPGLLWETELNNTFVETNIAQEVILTGHNTYKKLKNVQGVSKIIVLSKTMKPGKHDNAYFYNSLRAVLEDHSSFIILGGGSMFEQFLPIADMVLITTIGMQTRNTDECIYFPVLSLENSFYLHTESKTLSDTEKLSKINVELIFSRWERKRETLH